MRTFFLYNQYIDSDIDLSILGVPTVECAEPKKPSVRIIARRTDRKYSEYLNNQTELGLDYGYYYKEGLAFFEFENATTIKVNPLCSDISHDLVRVLLNYPISSIMYQQGFFCLHASAVEFNNDVYVFVGRTQDGKSTLAAHMIKLGAKLITEDTAVMKFCPDGVYIYPSYPLIKISDEANRFLNFKKGDGIVFSSDLGCRKGYFVESGSFCSVAKKINFCIFPEWSKKSNFFDELPISKSLSKLMEASLTIYPLIRAKEKTLLHQNIRFLNSVKAYVYVRQKSFISLSDMTANLKNLR